MRLAREAGIVASYQAAAAAASAAATLQPSTTSSASVAGPQVRPPPCSRKPLVPATPLTLTHTHCYTRERSTSRPPGVRWARRVPPRCRVSCQRRASCGCRSPGSWRPSSRAWR
jgi:hypothetical protein